jgi:hypothetical protein
MILAVSPLFSKPNKFSKQLVAFIQNSFAETAESYSKSRKLYKIVSSQKITIFSNLETLLQPMVSFTRK